MGVVPRGKSRHIESATQLNLNGEPEQEKVGKWESVARSAVEEPECEEVEHC